MLKNTMFFLLGVIILLFSFNSIYAVNFTTTKESYEIVWGNYDNFKGKAEAYNGNTSALVSHRNIIIPQGKTLTLEEGTYNGYTFFLEANAKIQGQGESKTILNGKINQKVKGYAIVLAGDYAKVENLGIHHYHNGVSIIGVQSGTYTYNGQSIKIKGGDYDNARAYYGMNTAYQLCRNSKWSCYNLNTRSNIFYESISQRGKVVENVVIRDIRHVGIFVKGYAKQTLITGVNIGRVSGVSIYLDQESHETTIQNSHIFSCSYGDYQYDRECIAIDSSYKNTIKNNVIKNHEFTAIALFKNCGEVVDGIKSPKRYHTTNWNTIKNNTFHDSTRKWRNQSNGWNNSRNAKYSIWINSRYSENSLCYNAQLRSGERLQTKNSISDVQNTEIFNNNFQTTIWGSSNIQNINGTESISTGSNRDIKINNQGLKLRLDGNFYSFFSSGNYWNQGVNGYY